MALIDCRAMILQTTTILTCWRWKDDSPPSARRSRFVRARLASTLWHQSSRELSMPKASPCACTVRLFQTCQYLLTKMKINQCYFNFLFRRKKRKKEKQGNYVHNSLIVSSKNWINVQLADLKYTVYSLLYINSRSISQAVYYYSIEQSFEM